MRKKTRLEKAWGRKKNQEFYMVKGIYYLMGASIKEAVIKRR